MIKQVFPQEIWRDWQNIRPILAPAVRKDTERSEEDVRQALMFGQFNLDNVEVTYYFLNSIIVSRLGIFQSFVQAKVCGFSAHRSFGLPFFSFRVPQNTFNSSFRILARWSIPHILLVIYVSEIFNLIVGWIAINVIHFTIRPFPVMKSPNNPSFRKKSAINTDAASPIIELGARPASGAKDGRHFLADQKSRFLVVCEKFAQSINLNGVNFQFGAVQ